jgi:hypothetical protein
MTIRASLGVALLCGAAVTARGQSITVTSPANLVTWGQNSTQTITWTTTGIVAGQTVTLILRRNNAPVGDIAAGVSAIGGSYTWKVGVYQGGVAAPNAGYQVRVRLSAALFGDSSTFNIGPDATTPTLALASPNGGQSWTAGSTQWIVWTGGNLTGTLKLELLHSNAAIGTIAEVNVTNWGYPWKVGQYAGGTAPAGPGYAVRITSDTLPLSDVSQTTFSIVAAPLAGALPTPGRVVPIQLPDLVTCLRSNTHIHVPGSGTISAKVKNVGQGASPATRVRIHIHQQGSAYRDVPPLSPGQIVSVGRHEYYTFKGKEHLIVVVDPEHQVVESNENNNYSEGTLHKTLDKFWPEEPFLCSDGTQVP